MRYKWKTFLAIMVVVALMIPAQVFGARFEELTVTKLKVKAIERLNAASGLTITNPTITGLIGAGNPWYVDSSLSASGDGESWLNAVLTIDEAINLASGSNGDVIHVAAGHAESFTAANGFDADVAGLTIIGYGTGTDMPELTFADTDADIALGAANVTLYNLRFLAGIDAVVRGISVEAVADDCAIIACEFPEPTTSTFEFVRAILLATGADRLRVEGCTYLNADAIGTTNFIDMDTGIVNGVQIIDNYIYGEFAEGAIHTDKVCLEMLIKDNTIVNMTTGQHGIEIAGDATGLLVGNLVSTDAIGTSYDVGHLNEHDNYWDDYGTYDTMAVPWTTNETGVNRWGATELAQIEAEVEDEVQDQNLDHLAKIAVDTNFATTVHLTSVLGQIADNGSSASFDASTDSLEAISLALEAGTGVTTAIDADALDRLISTDDRSASLTYPDSVADESIMAFVMSKSASPVKTSYNNTTHSLEAIGDLVTDTNQEARHVAGNVTDMLDHFAKTIDGGTNAYPDSPVNESITAYILSKSAEANVSSYDNQTDSLEMSSDKHGAFTGDGGGDQDDSAKASLDLVHTDLDAGLRMGGLAYLAVVDSSADTTHFVDAEFIGFGTDFFETSWTMIVIWDAAGASAAPEGEVVDISAFDSSTGTFTHGATTQLGVGDKIIIIRDAFKSLDHLIATSDGTAAYPASVASESILGYIMGVDGDPTGFDEATDSLEALGVKTTDQAYWQERTIAMKTAIDETDNLFDVAGGSILIKSFVGKVTTLIGATVATCKINLVADDGFHYDFSTAVNVETDVAGVMYVFTDANPAVLTPLTPSASGASTLMSPWYCEEGMITQTYSTSALGSGITEWYMTYVPLETGVVVTAQ